MRRILRWGVMAAAAALLSGCYYYPYPAPYYYGYPPYGYYPYAYPAPSAPAPQSNGGTVTPQAPASGTITPTPSKQN